MNGSEQFRTRIEDFLKEKSLTDSVFAPMLDKAPKSVEDCLKYIIAEVKKTGFCAFDDSEIFDMAVKYYTDDTIGIPPEIKCKVVVNQPKEADLFSASAPLPKNALQEIPSTETPLALPAVRQTPKPAQTTLTLLTYDTENFSRKRNLRFERIPCADFARCAHLGRKIRFP